MGIDMLQLIVLSCADLTASVRFYAGALGLTLVQADERMAVLRAGVVQVMLDAAQDRAPERQSHAPPDEPLCDQLVFKVSDLDGLVERLGAAGIELALAGDQRTGRICTVRDPDGRQLHLAERAL